ncbi:MAG: 50S ribosomal protein L13 [Candidatus Peregrinibacteria bacterium]|nr:50S ribosomal protein L13 [Candidatus Peregrinibacteria bacterium]
MKTTLRQNVTNADRKWFVVDANGINLGKLAVSVANALRGKNRTDYTPHVDGGDFVVILNADKIAVSGKKETDKKYYRHSGYLGNLKTESLAEVREKNPVRILEEAVSGMLPKNKLRKHQMRRLFLIVGEENPHEAQKPEQLKI